MKQTLLDILLVLGCLLAIGLLGACSSIPKRNTVSIECIKDEIKVVEKARPPIFMKKDCIIFYNSQGKMIQQCEGLCGIK